MSLDIKLLETFKAVVEARSATHAANILGITQPAVSAQVARLEDAVGFRLFDRSGGRLRPTNEGLAFYDGVANALDSVIHLEQRAESIRNTDLGHLAIASHPSAGISLLPKLIAEFKSTHAGVSVGLATRNSEVVRSLFPSRLYDLGIAELPIDFHGIEVKRYRLRCVAALPKRHPLAGEPVITPAMLSGLPFFAISRERASHHTIAQAFADAHAKFNVIGEAELFASVSGVVAAGDAVSVIDPWTANSFHAHIAVRPFEPAIAYDVAVFHSADRAPSMIAAEFLKLLDRRLRESNSLR
jgi:DNA-binding transcriptional LysR family regulator